MASIRLIDYIDIGSQVGITAVSYQFATDDKFTNIIDESIRNTKDLKEWHSPLAKPGGGYYADLDALYGRVMLHVNEYDSEWYEIGPVKQN